MTATEILKTALNLGINLSVIGDKLTAQPAQLLTCELRDAIKSCKSELIHLLKSQSKRAVIRFQTGKWTDRHNAWRTRRYC